MKRVFKTEEEAIFVQKIIQEIEEEIEYDYIYTNITKNGNGQFVLTAEKYDREKHDSIHYIDRL